MGNCISPWLISIRFIAANSWRRPADGGAGTSSVSRLRAEVASVPGWHRAAGPVARSHRCSAAASDNRSCVSLSGVPRETLPHLTQKQNRWRPFIFGEEINMCRVTLGGMGSTLKKMAIFAVGKETGQGDWSQFPETPWGRQMVVLFEVSENSLNLLSLVSPPSL